MNRLRAIAAGRDKQKGLRQDTPQITGGQAAE
jgi:hypothetical protein